MGASNYLSIRSRLEVGPRPGHREAARHGLATILSFIVAGAVPLAAYLVPLAMSDRFPVAISLTLLTLFGIGAARSLVAELRWWRGGLEMLLVGTIAAVVAYAIGALMAMITGDQAVILDGM